MKEGRDMPRFGDLPFDQFVVANWDVASPLSKNEQKRSLVEKWIALGKYGRNDYYLAMFDDESMDQIIDHPPVEVPQDLLSEEDRSSSCLLSTTLWIRTWFGDPIDKASQEAADTAYAELRKEVLQQGDEDREIFCIEEEFIFEDRQELSMDTQRDTDIIEGVAAGRPGSVPGYLITALMHCPELFEGTSDDRWRYYTGEKRAKELTESNRRQSALVLVADRKACEEGWVLLLAVNHRGEILPVRVRARAFDAYLRTYDWDDEVPLAELMDDEDEDVEYYLGQEMSETKSSSFLGGLWKAAINLFYRT